MQLISEKVVIAPTLVITHGCYVFTVSLCFSLGVGLKYC